MHLLKAEKQIQQFEQLLKLFRKQQEAADKTEKKIESLFAGKPQKKRTTVTEETREQLTKLVKQGLTGAQIADQLEISIPTVQNLKKKLGLVKAR